MSLRVFSSCCCSCTRGEGDETGYDNEVDYLLPGGEWDPSVSRSTRRHSKRSRSRHSSRGSEATSAEGGTVCAYVPPEVPGATSMPTFQDFRLLKTVGKGAFGKVC